MGVMKYIGAAYILWLAIHIVFSKPSTENAEQSASFLKGFMLQFVNVKIYMFGVTALPGQSPGRKAQRSASRTAGTLEQLYQEFNCARPTDYHGHSLSVSDVIMLNQDGKISAHYVDSIGFKELPGFLDKKPERTSVLQTLKEKCDAPECNPTVCRKVRDEHEL